MQEGWEVLILQVLFTNTNTPLRVSALPAEGPVAGTPSEEAYSDLCSRGLCARHASAEWGGAGKENVTSEGHMPPLMRL